MKALTIRQPWAWAVLHGGKGVENRGWTPPHAVVGKFIALHASQSTPDVDDAEVVASRSGLVLPPAYDVGAVVGVARVMGWVYLAEEKKPPRGSVANMAGIDWRWYDVGCYGWVLRDVMALKEPVECKGALKVWTLPAAVSDEVLAQVGGLSRGDIAW